MNLTIKEILVFGLKTTKKYYREVLIVIAIYFLFNLIPGFITKPPLLSFIVSLVFLVFETFFQIGVTKESLKIIRGGEGDIKNTFNYKFLFFRVILAWIIYGIFLALLALVSFIPFLILSFFIKSIWIMYLGALIAVLVAIVSGIVFGFSKIIVIDTGCTPIESLKKSKHLTKGVLARLALIVLAFIGFNLLGALALGIGLLVTVPSTFFALLFVYNSLLLRDNVVL